MLGTGGFGCSCAAGLQDNDGDGTCAPSCDAGVLSCPLGMCVDASGTALCDEPGLTGYWRVDELTGVTLRDASLNNLHGTVGGTPTRTGGHSGAPQDGALAAGMCWGVIPDGPLLDAITTATGVTLALWINPSTSVPGYVAAASREAGGGVQEHFGLYLHDGVPEVIIRGQCYLGGSAQVRPGAWAHLAFTYDGATLSLYQDGAEVRTTPCTQTFGADNNPLILGGNQNSGPNGVVSELFQGALDEVRLYARALSPDEVAQLLR